MNKIYKVDDFKQIVPGIQKITSFAKFSNSGTPLQNSLIIFYEDILGAYKATSFALDGENPPTPITFSDPNPASPTISTSLRTDFSSHWTRDDDSNYYYSLSYSQVDNKFQLKDQNMADFNDPLLTSLEPSDKLFISKESFDIGDETGFRFIENGRLYYLLVDRVTGDVRKDYIYYNFNIGTILSYEETRNVNFIGSVVGIDSKQVFWIRKDFVNVIYKIKRVEEGTGTLVDLGCGRIHDFGENRFLCGNDGVQLEALEINGDGSYTSIKLNYPDAITLKIYKKIAFTQRITSIYYDGEIIGVIGEDFDGRKGIFLIDAINLGLVELIEMDITSITKVRYHDGVTYVFDSADQTIRTFILEDYTGDGNCLTNLEPRQFMSSRCSVCKQGVYLNKINQCEACLSKKDFARGSLCLFIGKCEAEKNYLKVTSSPQACLTKEECLASGHYYNEESLTCSYCDQEGYFLTQIGECVSITDCKKRGLFLKLFEGGRPDECISAKKCLDFGNFFYSEFNSTCIECVKEYHIQKKLGRCVSKEENKLELNVVYSRFSERDSTASFLFTEKIMEISKDDFDVELFEDVNDKKVSVKSKNS